MGHNQCLTGLGGRLPCGDGQDEGAVVRGGYPVTATGVDLQNTTKASFDPLVFVSQYPGAVLNFLFFFCFCCSHPNRILTVLLLRKSLSTTTDRVAFHESTSLGQ